MHVIWLAWKSERYYTRKLCIVFSSVDEYLKLIYPNVLVAKMIMVAHSHFNVINCFLAQCGSEPWTTAITASAPTCTSLWVPQRVVQKPIIYLSSIIPRFAKIVFSHKWRCITIRIGGSTGAAAARVAVVLWISYCKGPDVVPRTAISHRQAWNIGTL